MPGGTTVTTTPEVAQPQLEQVTALVDSAARTDGYASLNEAAWLHLRHPRGGVSHLAAWREDVLVGYAQLDHGTAATTGSLVVSPEHRRTGVGSALVAEAIGTAATRLQFWAQGDGSGAQALARKFGFQPIRTLLIMTRDLTGELPEAADPPGVVIRPFRRGVDEEAWLAVNARAFAAHPEQGSLTRADLEDRLQEPWFDPSGFLLAESDGQLVGYHWTKQHSPHLGEVYVLGVDPGSGGRGLGRTLLAAGLRSLAQRGCSAVELYVEADHQRAVALYASHGFQVASRDVMYAQAQEDRR